MHGQEPTKLRISDFGLRNQGESGVRSPGSGVRRREALLAACGFAVLLLATNLRAETELGLQIPDGFEITLYADDDLAHDIYTMTIDPKGRVVVSGRGYVKILMDSDDDGVADEATTFADGPADGAMGLLWEDDALYVTGDGGLRVYHDRDGDDRADGPSELMHAIKTGGAHDAHAIPRGPDGWLYVLCGNMAGVDATFASLKTSPIKDPVAGCVLRFPPDFQGCEIVADGYRNPYDFDFNLDGELFTYDSDNERCVSLPWYEPTRFYHVIPHGHYGWQSPQRAEFFRYPPYFPDVIPPITYVRRGSPTGVECYKHMQFPERYQGNFFIADWTFGKIYFLELERASATYKLINSDKHGPSDQTPERKRGAAKEPRASARADIEAQKNHPPYDPNAPTWQGYPNNPEVFIESTGDNGFAPTDLAVHPTTGDLYISVGGRGTRGGVYRVRYTQNANQQSEPLPMAKRSRELSTLIDKTGTKFLIPDATRGSVWEGYSATITASPDDTLDNGSDHQYDRFPTNDYQIDMELARSAAKEQLSDSRFLRKVTEAMTADSDPVDDLHFLIVISRMKSEHPSEVTRQIAETLLALDRKCEERGYQRDTNWPWRIRELHAGLVAKDPQLNDELLRHPEFGRPDHTLFAEHEDFDRVRAAEAFHLQMKDRPAHEWTPAVVRFVGELPAERVTPVLRGVWSNVALRDEIIKVLAKQPDRQDSDKFTAGLRSWDQSIVALCRTALHDLGLDVDAIAATTRPAATDDADILEQWAERFAQIDWSKGNACRGERVYNDLSCAACHTGPQAIGPDLRGATKRFSTEDLFTAIVAPNRDIPDRYRSEIIETDAGQTYQGNVVYEAVDSLLFRTGPDATVRIDRTAIRDRRPATVSLMPAGLLDTATDQQIADLLAWLKSHN